MKRKLTYLNCVLTVIAIALTVIILQNAHVIRPASANVSPPPVDVNIAEINGYGFFGMGTLPVEIK